MHNNFKALVAYLLLSLSAQAANTLAPFRFELHQVGKQGHRLSQIFTYDATGGYRLNGAPLTYEWIALRAPALAALGKTATDTTSACEAGEYSFSSRRTGKAPVVEQGCIGSERHASLHKAFAALSRETP